MISESIELRGILVNIFSTIVAIEFIDHGFEKKYKGVKRYMLFMSGCIAYFLLLTGLNYFTAFEGILGIGYCLVTAGYGLVALNGDKRKIIAFSFIWLLIAMISSYVMFVVWGIATDKSLKTLMAEEGNIRIYLSIAAGTLKFALGRIMWAWYRDDIRINRLGDWIVGCAFFPMFLIVLGMFRLEEDGLQQMERYYLSVCILVVIFGLILIVMKLYHKLGLQEREKISRAFRQETQEIQNEQMEALYGLVREVNHFQHDMQGKMDIIRGLLKNKKYSEAISCIESMGNDLCECPELPCDTKNEGLNAALTKAIRECKQRKIHFSYVVMGDLSRINPMDMGNLLYNLFTNGIEACMEVENNRILEIWIREDDGETEILLENSIKDSVMEKNPYLVSNKANREKHGFGMESIFKIIEKYNGEYSYTEENGRFIQNISLKK